MLSNDNQYDNEHSTSLWRAIPENIIFGGECQKCVG